jgi:hypothetical protein
MFTLVVIAVAISVIVGYVRHSRFMQRKRLAERAEGAPTPPAGRDGPR